MDGHCLTNEQILAFSTAFFQAERSQATVEKYLRSVRTFSLFLDGRPVTKDTVLAWKKYLQREENYSPSTINASLAALNYLFNFLGWADCRTHYLKIQRRLFRETGRELDRADYEKLIAAALGLGRERIALVMETICATGIRVGEVRYITVEAVRAGSATISLKGKIRTIRHLCYSNFSPYFFINILYGYVRLALVNVLLVRTLAVWRMKREGKKADRDTAENRRILHIIQVSCFTIAVYINQ